MSSYIQAGKNFLLNSVRGGRPEVVSEVDHFDSRRAGACLPPKRGDATGGHKARRYAVFVD